MTLVVASIAVMSLPAPKGPIASPVNPKLDLGEFWSGEPIMHILFIKNEGDATLEILRPSGPPGLALPYDRVIAPGECGRIPVTLNTKHFNGRFTKTVVVSTNDPANSIIRFEITGVAGPRVSVEPPSAAFSQITADAHLSKYITITNNTDQWMRLELEQAESGRFTAQLSKTMPGKQFELYIEANPPYEPHLNRGTISLVHNIVEQPRFELIPDHVALTGPPLGDLVQTIQLLNHGPGHACVTGAWPDDPRVTADVLERVQGKAYDILILLPQ